MQCRYKERVVYAGEMIFGAVYPVYCKSGARRGKYKETTETQRKLNERKSRERFTWLVHTNFTRRDIALHMTYTEDNKPENLEQLEKDIKNFIRRMGRIYRKAGIEFKYIYVTEYSEKGRPHAHMIVSGGVKRDELEKAWGMGYCNADRLQFDESGIIGLSRYMTKQKRSAGKRRFSASRNMIQPEEKTDEHTWSKKQLEEIEETGNPHRAFMDVFPGYCLSEYPEIDKNSINGGIYMTFVMYKADGDNVQAWKRKTKGKTRGRGIYGVPTAWPAQIITTTRRKAGGTLV